MSKVVERTQCPNCKANNRDTSEDNLAIYDDGHVHCYACGFHNGKVISDLNYTYEYLPWRGVTKETMAFYDIKTKVDVDGKPVAVGFKYSNGAYKIRKLDHKDFYTEGDISQAGLFGREKFAAGSHKHVVITEGELDAASLYQTIRAPCVSVQSAGVAHRDCSNDRSWLNSFERIYLAFDADQPGREAAASVAKLFDYNRVYHIKFDRRKDANEYVQHGEDNELRQLFWNAKKFLPESIVSSFSDFKKILSEEKRNGIPYPFPTLTQMTYGIRTGESVLITAQEGVGKTELMHAIEYQLLRETKDNVGAIFLEEPKRRHLEALAGVHLKVPAHLPDSGITPEQVMRAVEDIVGVDDRLHVYGHFGSDDPEVLIDTIRFLVAARGCRYVLLDHITMAVSGLAGEDERRALDYLSTRLEMMVKELDFALIFVSHVNDDGKTRGSRYISKIADIRIDATRDVVSGSNVTELVVSKNRFSGRTGPAGSIEFDPDKYVFITQQLWGDNDNGRHSDVRAA